MTNRAAHIALAALAIVSVTIVVAACSGGATMTTAEYNEWCEDLRDERNSFAGETIGDLVDFGRTQKREYEHVADRVPEGARSGHNRVEEWMASISDFYNDYDRDSDPDDIPSAAYHAWEREHHPGESLAGYYDNWCGG